MTNTERRRERPCVNRQDWDPLGPMPERHATIAMDLAYDESRMALIRLGFKPSSMDEKWFIYFADDQLYFHRSWTGNLIFILPFKFGGDGLWHADHAIASRDPETYEPNPDEEEERRLIQQLIENFLLDFDDSAGDGFLASLKQAMQPNYLGSPQVVRDAITPLFAARVGWWLHLQDKSMPTVALSEVADTENAIARIFAGEDPDYTAMPWHDIDQLGQSAITRFNLNADYCADESMLFVMVESVSAISLAITSLLKAYLADPVADWPEAVQQLHRMQEFVEAVMLGTADIAYPSNKTLRDFGWQGVSKLETDDATPTDPYTHPKRNEKGQTVTIKQPHTASSPGTWSNSDAILSFVPGGKCPGVLNGTPFNTWKNPPGGDGWDDIDGQIELDEPTMYLKGNKLPASGVVIEEPDGRVWVASPTNRFGGYINTFPKGKASDEVSLQANAIKEAFEESGLRVRIVGYIGDVERSTTVTRYYRAIRVGGRPVDMGWESQAVHLVPRNRLPEFLDSQYDRKVISLAFDA